MRGRKRKPALIKRIEGNRSRVQIPNEIRGTGRLRVPDYFSPEERRLWAAINGSLPIGLLTGADQSVLERMAVAWARFRECQREIAVVGLVAKGDRGQSVRNPLLIVQKQAAEEMQACGEVLGLSPVARTRITADSTADDDPLSLLLDGRRDGAYYTPAPIRKN
jgi:P27 family predicted phage terminase small subunit